MTILNNLLLILVALAFGALIAGFLLILPGNVRQGKVFRQKLAQRIGDLRMHKMLRALGIDQSSYLHARPAAEIKQSVKRCEECANTDECDNGLDNGTLQTHEIGFCANQEVLHEVKQQQERQGNA